MADQTGITPDNTNHTANPAAHTVAIPGTDGGARTFLIEGTSRNSEAGKEFRKRYGALRRAIGVNIEHIRKGQNIPLRILARKTGISAETLDYWEMGRMEITLAGIIRIAAALGVSHATLLKTGDTEDNPGPEDHDPDDSEDSDCKDSDCNDPDENDDDLWYSFETQIDRAVAARERRSPMGFPDRDAVFAMEEPMNRLMGAAVLFYDHATALEAVGDEARAIGLVFLSQTMKREADRVYRLYFGHPHDG